LTCYNPSSVLKDARDDSGQNADGLQQAQMKQAHSRIKSINQSTSFGKKEKKGISLSNKCFYLNRKTNSRQLLGSKHTLTESIPMTENRTLTECRSTTAFTRLANALCSSEQVLNVMKESTNVCEQSTFNICKQPFVT